MNSELEIVFAQELTIVVLGELEVATLSREDWPRAARLLEEEHYLGDTFKVTAAQKPPAPAVDAVVSPEENKTRAGNWAFNASLALLSVKFRQSITLCWPRIFEQCAHFSVSAMALIDGKSVK